VTPFDVFRRDITVYRRAAGSYAAGGLYQQGTETSFVITASVQPATGEALQALPEGQRNLETYAIYTDSELKVAGEAPASQGDQLLINGRRFEVQSQRDWQNNVVNHRVYLAQKVSA